MQCTLASYVDEILRSSREWPKNQTLRFKVQAVGSWIRIWICNFLAILDGILLLRFSLQTHKNRTNSLLEFKLAECCYL